MIASLAFWARRLSSAVTEEMSWCWALSLKVRWRRRSPLATLQGVVTGAAVEGVATLPADDGIVAGVAEELVVAAVEPTVLVAAAAEDVVLGTEDDRLGTAVAYHIAAPGAAAGDGGRTDDDGEFDLIEVENAAGRQGPGVDDEASCRKGGVAVLAGAAGAGDDDGLTGAAAAGGGEDEGAHGDLMGR